MLETLLGLGAERLLNALGGYKTKRDEARETQEQALRIWGAILFECRANCEIVRIIAGGENSIRPHPLSFDISNALMGEFALIVRSPLLLNELQTLLAGLRRIDFFQRHGLLERKQHTQIQNVVITNNPRAYPLAKEFARAFLKRDQQIERFNVLLEKAEGAGKERFGDGWEELAQELLPQPLSSNEEDQD